MTVEAIASREERRKALRVVRICKCGAEMKNTYLELHKPFRFKHRCEGCGAEEWLERRYPFMEEA